MTNDAPERIWAEGGETSREAVDSLIVRLRVAYGGELSRDCAATLRALIARAEQDQAEKEAAVAAEREACISRLESLKDTAYQNKFLAGGVTYSCAIDAIRARADTDPLEAAKAEARAEALRELLQVNRVHRDKNWYPSLEQSILALLPADQEGDG